VRPPLLTSKLPIYSLLDVLNNGDLHLQLYSSACVSRYTKEKLHTEYLDKKKVTPGTCIFAFILYSYGVIPINLGILAEN
ncbi:10070_t:CDS:2, partial [Dentiscutata erythropus]